MPVGDNGHARFDDSRTEELYSFGEVARLADVSVSTVRNWLLGYTVKGREVQPMFNTAAAQGQMVSFLQLIELVVAAKFRKAERVRFRTVRRAYDNAKAESGLHYPFAHLRLEALGGHIVRSLRDLEPGVSVQTLDEPEQWTLPGLVLDNVQQLVYDQEDHLAIRWYPIRRDVPIVIDPRLSSGVPTVEGRGVTIQVLRKRWKADQPIDFIARDFALSADVVERALRYAEQVAA